MLKSSSFILSLFFFFSFLFLSNNVLAQKASSSSQIYAKTKRDTNRIVRTNWVNSMGVYTGGVCVQLLDDNILLFVLKSRFTDPFIANYPDMHFWYSYTLPYPIGPLPFFNLTDRLTEIHPAGIKNGIQIWEVRHTVEIDLSELCDLKSEAFDIEFTYQFVTKPSPSSVHIPYPYAPYPLMFPPDLFEIPLSGHSEEWTKTKAICCGQYGLNPNDFIMEGDMEAGIAKDVLDKTINANKLLNKKIDQFESTIENIRIFPNPFESNLNISYALEENTALKISCTDAMGKTIVLKKMTSEQAGNHELLLEMEAYPPGIYFFRFSSTSFDEVIKVMKLE